MPIPKQLQTTFSIYTLGPQLGQGGGGTVHRVTDETGTTWAAKLLSPGANSERRRRFKNEILFLQSTSHSNLVKVHDHGFHGSGPTHQPFYIMALFDGSLRELLGLGVQPSNALRLYDQILTGVEAAHLKGVVHRDLKPENILVSKTANQLVVADFGVAHFAEEALFTAVETAPNSRLANFQYAAPEQRIRGGTVGAPADIYALGLILNELFTGRVPHGTGYRTIESVEPTLAWLDPIVSSMIHNDPDRRPGSIDAIKRTLLANQQDFVTQQKISALSSQVVPKRTIEAPFLDSVPKIVDFDWTNGSLTLVFNEPIPEKWIWALHNMGNYRSVYGADPSAFHFSRNRASVSSHDDIIQRIIDQFKEWIPQATQVYRDRLNRDAREAEEGERKRLAAEKAALEQQARIRSSIRL